MATFIRNPGVVTALDDFTVTLRSEDGTTRRATRGEGFHTWVVVPGLKIGGRFTADAPEVGDVVSFITNPSIETVVVQPPAFDELPNDDELLAMLGQDTPATGAPAKAVEQAPEAPAPVTKPRRKHRRTTGARTARQQGKPVAAKGTKTMADAHA